MIKVTNLKATGGAALGVLLVGMLVAGCRTQSKELTFSEVPGTSGAAGVPSGASAAPETAAAPAPATAPATTPAAPGGTLSAEANRYQILQPGDAITIIYNDLPTIVPVFEGEIKPDGTITLIHNKTFQAAGKTVSQLEKDIRETYVPAYYKQMTVQVRLKDEKRLYYVGGEVRAAGPKMYLGRTTVLMAVQAAGDFTDFARKGKVTVTRRDGKQIKVDCNKALRDPSSDIEVLPGDTVHVPRRFW